MSREYVVGTKDFFWSGHEEYFINNGKFNIYNNDMGIQSSTFALKKGHYSVTISSFDMGYTDHDYILIGIPKLSGSEEQNQWLEKNQKSKAHIREFAIKGSEISIALKKDYLKDENLPNQKLYVYINKI